LALGLPEVIHQAAEQYDPSLLANFSYDVMKAYSSWYADHPILQEADESVRLGRLGLSELAAQVVARAMGLLGIEMPERM
jgi:arginyl-tRNA synthetase